MGKGSSGTKTTYTSSWEQKQIANALLPMIQGMAQQGVNQQGMAGMGVPNAPTAPSMSGVLSGVSPYQIPGYGISGYNVPSTSSMMPSQDWYNSLSPEVKAGVWAPYEEGANMLGERMGAQGQAGSARAGYSGAAGAAFGDYYADAANNATMNLWNMSQPAMQAGWNAQLGQNQYLANQNNQQSQWTAQNQLSQNQMGYQNQLTENQMNYQNQMNQQQQDYGMQKTAWGLPWALTGMMPSTYSQGITTQPSSPWGGMFGGMLTGGMMGGMMGQQSGNTGYGAAGGGLLGGLAGMFGG